MKVWNLCHWFFLFFLVMTACSKPQEAYLGEEEVEITMGSPDAEVLLPPSVQENSKSVSEAEKETSPPSRRNVILLIADGGGFGAFYSAADYLTGSPTGLFFQQPDWTFVSCATFHKKSSYEPEKDWLDFPNMNAVPPDSGSTATALNTGVKTRNGRINIGPTDERLTTLAELARERGMSVGLLTTTEIADATPAAVAGHEVERNHGPILFSQMLREGILDVMIGTGKPHQTGGRLRRYGPSPEDWEKLLSGDLPLDWVFVGDGRGLRAYLSGTTPLPKRLVGIVPEIRPRPLSFQAEFSEEASPSLGELTPLLFQMLQRNDRGFYAMIENGRVDRMNHSNDIRGVIEEMAEFCRTVEWVCDWVEKHSSWEETLVVVTADHDTGGFMGEGLDREGRPLSAPRFSGQGKLPVGKFYSMEHTKMLVPVYAKGRGAENLRRNIRGTDSYMAKYWHYDGKYIDNTDIFPVMRAVLTP